MTITSKIISEKYFTNIGQSFVRFNWNIIYHIDQISFPVLQIFNLSFFVCSEIFPISLCFVLFQCKVSQVGEKAESTNWKTLETLKYTVQRITDFTHIRQAGTGAPHFIALLSTFTIKKSLGKVLKM